MKGFVIPRRWMTIIGCSGIGLILVSLGIYVATANFSWYVKSILILGVAGLVVYWILGAMASRAARYGSNVAVMILLAFLILVLVNFVSARRFGRIDTTKGKQFSLSDQTKKILKSLEQDINVTAFYTEDHYRRRTAEDILNEYALQSSKFRLTFIDPNVKPGLAIAYNIRQNGTVVFESGEKREDVESYQNEEQDFTSAILKLIATEQKKLYFLDGHGEHDIDGYDDDSYGDLKKLIESEGYQVEKLVLAGQSSVPADCDVLIIAGPKKPLLSQEEELIASYLDSRGKAIIMIDPQPSPSLEDLLQKWGIEVRDDIVLDVAQPLFGDISTPATIRYDQYNTITTPLASMSMMTFFPMVRSLSLKTDLREGLEVTQLVKTSNDSWGELDTEALLSERRASYDEERDIKGPLNVAVAVMLKERSEGEPLSEPGQLPQERTSEKRVLVAVGDSDFVTNNWLKAGNPDLFMNSVNWLTEEEELISIRPKDQEQSQVQVLTGRQLLLITYSSIFAIPILLLIIGGVVWWKRR